MNKEKTTIIISIIASMFLAGCSDGNSTTTTVDTTTTGDIISTKQAVQNAQWDDNVTITYNTGTFLFESNGLPDSSYLGEKYLIPKDIASQPFSDNDISTFTIVSAVDYFKETAISTLISLFPQYSKTITATSLGQIGVVLNGAALFNDYENMELTLVALDDNVIHDHAAFVDECNGHSLQNGDSYHYHGIPTCITSKVDKIGQHSTMIGVLQDGFPVYGNKDTSGAVITNSNLDECSGHTGATPEFPDGIYHYHLTDDEAPYSIDCYHGEITTTSTSIQWGNWRPKKGKK